MVELQNKTKIVDYVKAEAISHLSFKYKNRNILKQTELVYYFYKNRWYNVLDSNINNIAVNIIDVNPYLLKQIISATQ